MRHSKTAMLSIALAVTTALTVIMSGCAQVAGFLDSHTGQTTTKFVTMRVIEKAQDPADKAERIKIAINDVESYLHDGVLTLTALDTYAHSKLDPKRMTASELLAWDEAINAVMADIRKRSPDELISADGRRVIANTIAAVREAIRLEGY